MWLDSLLNRFRLGGHQDGGSGRVLTSLASTRLGCWLGAGPGALQGRISLLLVKLLWLKPGRFTTYWDLELEYPRRGIWKRTEVQQILWNFMISFSFQSFEKGWVGERAAVLGKAPPPLSSSRKWAPGAGEGAGPRERGGGGVTPRVFFWKLNWKDKTKLNPTVLATVVPRVFGHCSPAGIKYCTFEYYTLKHFFLIVAISCLTLCNPVNCSTPGFPVLHYLLEFAQTSVHWVSDAIQPSHPLSSLAPLALNLSQRQGLYSELALYWY